MNRKTIFAAALAVLVCLNVSGQNAGERAKRYVENGDTFFARGDYDMAIACYTDAIKLDPNYMPFRTYFNRALAYGEKGDRDSAIADWTQLIRLFPDNTMAYANRAADYAEKGDYDRAIADFTQVLKLEPSGAIGPFGIFGNIWYMRGKAYLAKKDHEHAIADLTQVIIDYYEYIVTQGTQEAKYDLGIVYHLRGRAYQAKGDKKKANADFAAAKKLGYEE
ncbi:MAG: hypothetical protein Pg6C_10520 [Treponemataceae bacterium]|nr:MAG: hypothetical protein Pg6C_10520 [Treponemataceae bacterium]